MPIDKDFAAVLACPKCKGKLLLAGDETAFTCESCRLLYAIDDGIPNFLIDQARPLDGAPR